MAEDDYTLLSEKEVSELKQDVEYLKRNPLGGTKSGKSLLESIERLNDNIEQLIEIFKEASDQMKAEERESDVIIQKIQPIERRLAELSDQNQKIAKGILAVADMISEQPKQIQRPQLPRPVMPSPMSISSPPRIPQQGQSMSNMPMPPSLPPLMPPKKEEKKGLFGFK